MKTRLFHPTTRNKLTRQSFPRLADPNEEPSYPNRFACLRGRDVITAKISDHHPMIHDGVLFWNIMMQGNIRKDGGYNNGFGFIENDNQYMERLENVAHVIAEIVYQNPSIEIIGLCEGPVKSLHVDSLIQPLKKSKCMNDFFDGKDTLYQPSLKRYHPWGLLMLADKRYTVNTVNDNFVEQQMPLVFHNLANRFHLWQLTKNGEKKYLALGHFPFGGKVDAEVIKKESLSKMATEYADFVNKLTHQYKNEHFIFCADFNFNPYLISQSQDRFLDKITRNNSILLTMEERSGRRTIKAVTVDGILLSQREKQKYCSLRFNAGLFSRLEKEEGFLRSHIKEQLIRDRHHGSHSQRAYDEQFGLVPHACMVQ